ncbi:MAG TPA: mechanosensitive ion channel family protein [Candidatus Altiarchaeales archaeon]|nr:mechanosensitive ion channel family protein [Candidatus Altiarchaeales archaeon]
MALLENPAMPEIRLSFLQNGFLSALTVFAGVFLILWSFKKINAFRFRKIAKSTETDFDDIISSLIDGIPNGLIAFFSLFISLKMVETPLLLDNSVRILLLLFALIYAVKAVVILVDFGRNKVVEKKLEEKEGDVSIIHFLAMFLKYVAALFAILVFLSNIGINVSSLLAGLGIGGIAVALALQNVLEDLFSSVSIYFDKPFTVGDFLLIGDDLGAVEKIGIKTTRLKTLRGEELVVSNKEMTSVRIHNFGRMPHRRIDFSFGVTYQTPTEKLELIPSYVREIIESQELVTFDRAHFKKFGQSALEFEAVYYLKSADYNQYMDTQQAINIALKKKLDAEDIEFAYPTTTVYLSKTG